MKLGTVLGPHVTEYAPQFMHDCSGETAFKLFSSINDGKSSISLIISLQMLQGLAHFASLFHLI